LYLRISYTFKKIRAVVGSTKWKSPEAFKYEIDRIISHEEFDPNVYANDISLVKTSEPIIMKDTRTHYIVNAVCVPSNDTVPTEQATVYGWGLLAEEGEPSADLMKVTVKKFNTEKCNAAYDEFVGTFTPQMMCYASPAKDACKVCLIVIYY
jgi:hypothetical protein